MSEEQVTVRLSAIDELSRPVDAARRDLKNLGDEAVRENTRSAGSARLHSESVRALNGHLTSAAATMSGPLTRATQATILGFGAATAGAIRFGQSITSSLAGAVVTGSRYAGYALAGATTAAVTFGLKSAAAFQDYEVNFETLLGSAEAGRARLASLQQLDAHSALNLTDLAAAQQTLLQFGVTGLPVLKSISDVASTTGPDKAQNLQRIAAALGNINSNGVVQGQDLNQLVQAGFPAYQLLTDITGQTTQQIRKQMENGLQIPASKFMDAVAAETGALGGYSQAAASQAGTLSSQWSNFTDGVQARLATAFEPLAKDLAGGRLQSLTTSVGSLIDQVAPPLSHLLEDVLSLATRALPAAGPPLSALFTGLDRLVTSAGPALTTLGPRVGDLTQSVTGFFTALAPLMPTLVRAAGDLIGVLPTLVSDLGDLLKLAQPLGDLLHIITDLPGGNQLLVGLLAYRALGPVIDVVRSMAGAMRDLAAAEGVAAAAEAVTGGAAGAGAVAAGELGAARAGGLAAVAGGALGVGGLVTFGKPHSGRSIGEDVGTVGSGAVLGASIGSVVPGVGTLLGGAVGGALGLGWAVGNHLADSGGNGPLVEGQPAPYGYGSGSSPSAIGSGDALRTLSQTNYNTITVQPKYPGDYDAQIAAFLNERSVRK